MDSLERLTATIHGRVQGVMFRRGTYAEALRLGLSGTVRNAPDGTVRVVAEGARDRLELLLAWLQQGPARAHVTAVDATWTTPAGLSGFRIVG